MSVSTSKNSDSKTEDEPILNIESNEVNKTTKKPKSVTIALTIDQNMKSPKAEDAANERTSDAENVDIVSTVNKAINAIVITPNKNKFSTTNYDQPHDLDNLKPSKVELMGMTFVSVPVYNETTNCSSVNNTIDRRMQKK
ncbi:hypothetical protein ACOME3_005372 [Neoechinorhynchus agilis]